LYVLKPLNLTYTQFDEFWQSKPTIGRVLFFGNFHSTFE
jgi:hypothetical protein